MAHRAFLAHDWGIDELGRQNHDRVARVFRALGDLELKVWIDEAEMEGDTVRRIPSGIDPSDVVVVFITKRYCEKASGQGPNAGDDNCKLEFDVALHQKGVGRIVPVVMEPSMRLPRMWGAVLSGELGSKLYVDLVDDEDESFAHGINNLIKAIESACNEALPSGVVASHPQPAPATSAGVNKPPHSIPNATPLASSDAAIPLAALSSAATPLTALDVDQACMLLELLLVEDTAPFRRLGVNGSDLAVMSHATLRALGIVRHLRRDAVLAELHLMAQQGLSTVEMDIICALAQRKAAGRAGNALALVMALPSRGCSLQ